jgi:sugar lactone lactonase YvrE
MRPTVHQASLALLLIIATGCRSDSTTPGVSPQEGLWTASALPQAVLRLDPTQLSDTGKRDPATTLTTPSARLRTLVGVAFDDDGTMWVASQDDSLLLAFAPGALNGAGSRAARTVITSTRGSLSGPTGLAFDRQHRLWVINNRSATLVRFDRDQLAAGGPQAPAVTLRMPGNPVALAFDAAGSLWVSDNQFSIIVKFPAAQLATSGSPVPALSLTVADSLVNPAGLAFDAAGKLWVANTGRNNLVAFSPAQLAGTGPLAPDVTVSPTGGSLSIPVGLAFDGDGGLWVVGGAGLLTRFSGASLLATGAPAPDALLQVSGHSLFWSAAFWPRPAGLPLN